MKERESRTRVVRSLRGGQITIPGEFRRRLGITEASLLRVTLTDGELRIRPLQVAETAVGSPWLKQLYDLFAPVREEAKELPEQEINAAVDRAVTAARRKHAARGL